MICTLGILLVLPCGQILRDYTHITYIQVSFWVQTEVIKELTERAEIERTRTMLL